MLMNNLLLWIITTINLFGLWGLNTEKMGPWSCIHKYGHSMQSSCKYGVGALSLENSRAWMLSPCYLCSDLSSINVYSFGSGGGGGSTSELWAPDHHCRDLQIEIWPTSQPSNLHTYAQTLHSTDFDLCLVVPVSRGIIASLLPRRQNCARRKKSHGSSRISLANVRDSCSSRLFLTTAPHNFSSQLFLTTVFHNCSSQPLLTTAPHSWTSQLLHTKFPHKAPPSCSSQLLLTTLHSSFWELLLIAAPHNCS